MLMFLLNACKWVRLATGSKLKQFLWQSADYEVRKGDTAVTTHVLETPLPPLSRELGLIPHCCMNLIRIIVMTVITYVMLIILSCILY